MLHRRLLVPLTLLLADPAASAQATLYTVDGGPGLARYGTAVDLIADLDGDGLDEVLVGAYLDGTNGNQAGKVEVLSGASGSVIHVRYAESALDHFGFAVARAGDVDGDGFEDFVVGAPMAGFNSDGKVYVYSGLTGAEIWSVAGPSPFMRLGTSVAGAGDLDGDGRAEVIVGANGDDLDPNDDRGSATVYSGQDASVLHKFWGTDDVDGAGRSVAGGCDVDGDGIGDLIVGSLEVSLPNAEGEVQVFSGLNGVRLQRLVADTPFEWFGVSVASPGDLDGDGKDEVLVGAKTARPGDVFNAGAARVFSGATGALLYEVSEGRPAEFLGASVAGAGDVNGDGVGDLVVGAPAAVNFGRAGDAHVYSGVDGAPLYVFVGDDFDDEFGAAVAGGGDLTGDGLADLVVGAPRDDPNGSSSGSLRVFAGGMASCFSAEAFCQSAPNSVGAGALIEHLGSTSFSAKKFWLQTRGLPPFSTGQFLFAAQRAQVPFGNGTLCLGQAPLRTPARTSDQTGVVWMQFDPGGPVSGGVISVGTRWNFQYYYRDAGVGAGFNLSDGLGVVFCP